MKSFPLKKAVILTLALSSVFGCTWADASAATASTYVFRSMILGAAAAPTKFPDVKSFVYTGQLQDITVPNGAEYAVAKVGGGGGGMPGGAGGSWSVVTNSNNGNTYGRGYGGYGGTSFIASSVTLLSKGKTALPFGSYGYGGWPGSAGYMTVTFYD